MRVERHGGSPNLQSVFQAFVRNALKGRALDDNQNREAVEGRFPDFSCFRGMLLIEMKHLETSQNQRLNRVVDQKIDLNEKPIFYGSRNADRILDKVSNTDEINAAVASKLSRTIENILSSANRQCGNYRERHPRKNSISICVILNSQLQEYTPEVVLYAVHSKIAKSEQPYRFPNIDAVIYITEKHFCQLSDGRIAFAMANYLSHGIVANPWKTQFVEVVMQRWSQYRTQGEFVAAKNLRDFEAVEDIPRTMPRHEFWRLEYRRNPYMRGLSDEKLKVVFNRCIAQGSLAFIKGAWQPPPREHTQNQLRLMSHLMEEINHRGMDMRSFSPILLPAEDQAEIIRGLPPELAEMLSKAMQDAPKSG